MPNTISNLRTVRLRGIYNTFSAKFERFGSICIAGGAVRDSLMDKNPKDYDIFLFPNEQWADAFGLSAELKDELLGYNEISRFSQSSPHVVKTFNFMGYTIQLMITNASDVYDLMDTFDWNVCMYAYDGEYHSTDCLDNLSEGSHLKLHRITRAKSTLRRGFRFSDRYGLLFPDEELNRLILQIQEDARCHDDPDIF